MSKLYIPQRIVSRLSDDDAFMQCSYHECAAVTTFGSSVLYRGTVFEGRENDVDNFVSLSPFGFFVDRPYVDVHHAHLNSGSATLVTHALKYSYVCKHEGRPVYFVNTMSKYEGQDGRKSYAGIPLSVQHVYGHFVSIAHSQWTMLSHEERQAFVDSKDKLARWRALGVPSLYQVYTAYGDLGLVAFAENRCVWPEVHRGVHILGSMQIETSMLAAKVIDAINQRSQLIEVHP